MTPLFVLIKGKSSAPPPPTAFPISQLFHKTPLPSFACLLTPPLAGMRENWPPNSPYLSLCLCQSLAPAGSWNCKSPCLQCIVIADIGSAVTCNFILSCFADALAPLGVRHLALASSTFGRKSAPPSSWGESSSLALHLFPFFPMQKV